jgi:geranylgeranyl pyrophosphate synthase
MKFEDYIEEHRGTVYKTICGYLPSGPPEEHYKMVRAYVDRQGKYARPSLLLLWTELHGGKLEDAMLPAAAQQTSEDWILMLDDWMDGNELRRGKPTAHIMYGDRFAVNAGVGLLMIMSDMAFDAAIKLGKPIGTRYWKKFQHMLLVTDEGQYIDMHLTHDVTDIKEFTLDDYYDSIRAKSEYYSVYGPMQLGTIIAGMDERYVERIEEYGEPIGKAFQTKDDILDCTSTEAVLGKSIGNDVRDGVKTGILWHFVQKASASDLEKVRKIYMKDRRDKTEGEVNEVLKFFEEYGSIAYAESEVDRLAGEALKKFEDVSRDIPESDLKKTARDAIIKLASRKK